jgi:hypothetical protein
VTRFNEFRQKNDLPTETKMQLVEKAEGKRPTISKTLRDSVFTTYNQTSYDDAYCYVGCGEKITPKGNPFKTLRHKEGV